MPNSFLRCGLILLGANSLFAAMPNSSPVIEREFIYETAPFPQCHASTIVESKQGLVAAWFGGLHEKHAGVGIWVARRSGPGWTTPVEVANGVQFTSTDGTTVRHPTWNPVLFQPATGPLMLFYKVGPTPQTWWGMLTTSADGGKTWDQPRRLPAGILGPIKNKPIQLADGAILCPTSDESPTAPSRWQVRFESTRDFGRTWTTTPALHDGAEIAAIQPSLLWHGGSRLQAMGRTRQGRLFEIWSEDAGRTWGSISLTDLPNPNSGTDAVTLADGRHLLVYNHNAQAKGGRTPLNLAVSRDGKTWEAALVLEDEPGEYSYPAIIQTRDGNAHITYTWRREKVRHVVVDPKRLQGRPMAEAGWTPGESGKRAP
ncbi:MAG: hypothetical protein RIQ93_1079 [Verrucomicrobiota bacterium]